MLLPGLGASAAQTIEGDQRFVPPTIPNFFDPRARIEKPAAGSVGPIRFLTTDTFLPFNFRDRRGVLMGFNVDLARAICDVLDTQCAIQARPFDTLEPALKAGEGDAVIAGLAATPEREAAFGFTTPYLKAPGRFVTREGVAFDPQAIQDKKVAAVCGSPHESYLKDLFPGATASCRDGLTAAMAALKEGEVDAVFADGVALSFWLHDPANAGCCAFAGGPYVDDGYFGSGFRIALRSDDADLARALDYALREVHRNGTYEELYLRYFPVGFF